MAKTMCLYGSSGSCKTSALATFVTGMYRATGKKARLYNVDGGVASIQHLIDAGLCSHWELGNHPHPFEAVVDASRGYWPLDVKDPRSPLEPPTLTRWIAECAVDQTRAYDSDKPATTTVSCPKCRAIIPVRERQCYNPRNKLDDIGVILYEGLTGFSERLLDSMTDKLAIGDGKIGGDIAVKFKDGRENIGGLTQSAYGVAQRRAKTAVEASRLLPVPWVIWTAHKDRGTDDMKRVPVFGPKLAGHAATDDAPRWFSLTFSATNWPMQNGSVEKRLYISNYYESFNATTKDVEHICNTRIPPSVLDGVPPYYDFKPGKKDDDLLWRIVQMIEGKQKEAATQATAGVTK